MRSSNSIEEFTLIGIPIQEIESCWVPQQAWTFFAAIGKPPPPRVYHNINHPPISATHNFAGMVLNTRNHQKALTEPNPQFWQTVSLGFDLYTLPHYWHIDGITVRTPWYLTKVTSMRLHRRSAVQYLQGILFRTKNRGHFTLVFYDPDFSWGQTPVSPSRTPSHPTYQPGFFPRCSLSFHSYTYYNKYTLIQGAPSSLSSYKPFCSHQEVPNGMVSQKRNLLRIRCSITNVISSLIIDGGCKEGVISAYLIVQLLSSIYEYSNFCCSSNDSLSPSFG